MDAVRFDWCGVTWYFMPVNNLLLVEKDTGDTWRKKAVRVEDCNEYTYKLLKTKIKAIGGAAGLHEFMKKCIEDKFGESLVNTILNYSFDTMREAK